MIKLKSHEELRSKLGSKSSDLYPVYSCCLDDSHFYCVFPLVKVVHLSNFYKGTPPRLSFYFAYDIIFLVGWDSAEEKLMS